MYLGAYVNSIIAIIGTAAFLWLILMGLISRDKTRLRQAGLVFVGTLTILVIVGLADFFIVVLTR